MAAGTAMLGTARSSPFPLLVAAAAVLVLGLVAPPADAADAPCYSGDKAALLELKASVGNPPLLSSWKNATDCCSSWGYMECDNGGRVTSVDIQGELGCDLNGTLPASIGSLTYLRTLIFGRCPALVGGIPAEISGLTRLEVLRLERNGMSGGIPAGVRKLHRLTYLSLSQNRFAGKIPPSLGGLSNLEVLYLDSNGFSGGIPATFQNLDLVRANLSFNNFSGDASPLFDWWKRTKTLDISTNAFSFDLCDVTFPLELEIFNMSANKVYGCIPDNADDLTSLKKFNVSHNELCGEIPQGGVINRFNASAFEHNDGLCGHPLPPCDDDVMIRSARRADRAKGSY